MRLRPILLAIASLTIGGVLIACLIAIGKIDPRETAQKLRHTDAVSFAVFTVLMALHILLSTQKWRIIDAVIRRPGDAPVPPSTAFALSSGGIALGQLVPAAMGMAVARTLGTYVHGRAFTRGTVGTIFEQGFDFLVICFLIPASVATRLFKGGALMWTGIAMISASAGLLAIGAGIRLLERIAILLAVKKNSHPIRLQQGFAELRDSGLLNSKVARELAMLSIVRFVILVLMAWEATRAIGIDVPLWHLAGAMPFVIFSSVIAISPGALGVSELTYATALSLFGTPLPIAAQFALANRFLVAAAAFIIAICSAGILLCKQAFAFSEATHSEGLIQ